MFVLSGLPKDAEFPPGFAAPNEAEALVQGGKFIGGQGLVQVSVYSFLTPIAEFKCPLVVTAGFVHGESSR